MYPLDQCEDGDVLDGGYAFGQWTGAAWHPGLDLNSGVGGNADAGLAVRSCEPATVHFLQYWNNVTKGEGNHLWLKGDWSGKWIHHDHLLSFAGGIGVDVRVGRGTILGFCGRTGGWPYAHDHFEVSFDKPQSWWQWTKGWTKAQMLAAYQDPHIYVREMDQLALSKQQEDVVIGPDVISDEEIAAYMGTHGHPVNFGMRDRAILAYRREENPGPAVSGEYQFFRSDLGYETTRQKFETGIFEYDPVKHQVARVQIVLLHPELQ